MISSRGELDGHLAQEARIVRDLLERHEQARRLNELQRAAGP